MVSWRPIRGKITILDAEFTTLDDIEAFFAAQRVLGRGQFTDDDVYEFEIAVGGRRRRVASVDDDGKVFRGIAVTDLLDKLSTGLRKVEVELAGAVRHGPIDLGAVEVGDDDLDALTEPEPEVESSANDAADEPYDVAGDALPELESGAMVLISDIALSEVPLLAKSERKTLGVLRLESSRVIVANESFDLHRKVFPRPSYSIVLTLDADTHSKPVMIVRRDDMRLTWDWSSAGEPFAWIADAGASTPDTDTPDDGDDSNAEVSAAEFVDSELGAGGVARLAVADLIDVRFADLRDALLADAAQGPRKVLELFGLPPEVADVLEGKRAVEDIPGAQIVEPKRAASTFEESLAWEIAGEGVVEPDMAKAYREVYLKRPWLTSVVAAGQAAIGGGVFMAGLRPRPGNTRSKLAIAVGAVLVVNALSRIGVSEYVQRALERNTNSGGVSE